MLFLFLIFIKKTNQLLFSEKKPYNKVKILRCCRHRDKGYFMAFYFPFLLKDVKHISLKHPCFAYVQIVYVSCKWHIRVGGK